LPLDELLRITKESQAEDPAPFQFHPAKRVAWHRQQVTHFGHLSRVEKSLFHLDRLIGLEPENPTWTRMREELAVKQVPLRDPATSSKLIDLGPFYTRSFKTLIASDGYPAELGGVQRLAGTDFDARGLIVLQRGGNNEMAPRHDEPARVGFIPVHQRCDRLHFLLNGYDVRSDKAGLVGKFIIHSVDGSQRTFPLIYGKHLRNWSDSPTTTVTDAVVARQGPPKKTNGKVHRLYKATWENPTPEFEISHLDFETGELDGRPLLVAITAE
jgi:hypothetical protein